MPFIDTSILISNITKLMNESHTTQLQLAEHLGISQPNVSKALSTTDKKCFTLDQVAGIAKYFNVSVDWLLGIEENHHKTKASMRAIAEFTISLVEQKLISTFTHEVKEEIYEFHVEDPIALTDCPNITEKTVQYSAFYFPSYWHIPGNVFGEEWMALQEEIRAGNQILQNQTLNSVIDAILHYHSLSSKKLMDEELYKNIKIALLNSLPDE